MHGEHLHLNIILSQVQEAIPSEHELNFETDDEDLPDEVGGLMSTKNLYFIRAKSTQYIEESRMEVKRLNEKGSND
jgi:hypothetical protein